MSMNPNRINFTPTADISFAITKRIKEVKETSDQDITRLDALTYFVRRGIEDWQRDNLAKQAMNQSNKLIDPRKIGK